MDDKIADLLAQYDLTVYKAGRVKGAWILETEQGLKNLGSISYSEGKVRFEQKIKEFAGKQGFSALDFYVPSREQQFLVQGPYNETFVMRNWFLGEECNAKCREEVLLAVKTLARLHTCMSGVPLTEEEKTFCSQPRLTETLKKRNKELRRVRAYIRSKKQKSQFEQEFLSQFELQFSQAEQSIACLDSEEYSRYYEKKLKEGSMLHGSFTHHSVLVLSKENMAVTGFEKAMAGIQIFDLYLLFRKMMEKWEWDTTLGADMLSAYDHIRPIPMEEYRLLPVLLAYPEKFWKVANQYYNNRKSWIPEKNMQKLLQTMEQAEKKEESIKTLFR